jgi:hypothetical protein
LLAIQREYLMSKIDEINESIDFIDNKQAFFDCVLAGEIECTSNLIQVEQHAGCPQPRCL